MPTACTWQMALGDGWGLGRCWDLRGDDGEVRDTDKEVNGHARHPHEQQLPLRRDAHEARAQQQRPKHEQRPRAFCCKIEQKQQQKFVLEMAPAALSSLGYPAARFPHELPSRDWHH